MNTIITKKEYKKFWSNGFLHLKNVFTHEEIHRFKSRIEQLNPGCTGRIGAKQELLSDDILSDFVTDYRIVEIAKTLLNGNVIYFGDSVYHGHSSGVEAIPGKWHKDNVDRDDADGLDWKNKEYPIIRFGIYLQDHKKQGGGLMLRKKSHLAVSRKRKHEIIKEEIVSVLNFRNKYIASEVGDLVVWTLKTSHAAMGRHLRGIPSITVSQRMSRKLPKFVQTYCKHGRRYLVTATYAAPGVEFDRYLECISSRADFQRIWPNSSPIPEKVSQLESEGVKCMFNFIHD